MRLYRRVILVSIVTLAGILFSSISAQPPAPPPPPSPLKAGAIMPADPPIPATGEGATFSARVLDAVTGAPIPGVSIGLNRQASPTSLVSWTYKSTSNPHGEATIPNMAADRYTIYVTQPGHTLVADSERMVALTAGAKPNPMIFRMHKSSTIEGTLEDRDRNPVVGARVELLEERWTAGQRTLARIQESAPSRADGTYRIEGVLPGSYYLRAKINPNVVQQQLRDSDKLTDPAERHIAYVNSLYPGVQFLEQATPILVYPGANQQGVRIEIQKSKYYLVHGSVDNLSKEVPTPGLIFIRTVSFDSRFPFIADQPYDESLRTNIAPDGAFSYEIGVPPGQYWMGYTPGGQANRFGGMDVRVIDKDVELKTELWSGFPFEGKMVYEDGTPATGITTSLRTFWDRRSIREDSFATNREGKFNQPLYSDGTFRIEFPSNRVAIQKIEKDGRTFTGPEFQIISQGGPATITVTRKGASISGSVQLHETTKAYPRGMETLSLEPANPLDNPKRKRLDGTTTFAFEHLAAGRYRLCAWTEEGTEINRVLGNPYYDQRLAALCRSVEVKIDETKTTDLKQISALEIQ